MQALQFDKIDTQSVVNNIVNQISSMIINKKYCPGDRIPTETELASQLNVSRNSVREAIKILISIGILEVQRGRGTFVTSSISPTIFDPLIFSLILEHKTNKDLYEFRMIFDTMVLFCACDKINTDQIKRLRAIVDDASKRYHEEPSRLSIDYFIEQDILFHKYLLEVADNPLIQRIGYSILNFIPEYIRKSILQKNGITRSIHNHNKIINILEQNNKNAIHEIIESTLTEWKNDWKEE